MLSHPVGVEGLNVRLFIFCESVYDSILAESFLEICDVLRDDFGEFLVSL
jgi:hypothetical protein